MRFSKQEKKDLFIAWILISIAFAIALRGQNLQFTQLIGISLVTVGMGFVVHELAHKYVAQHYSKSAEFEANLPMLAVSILIAFAGIVVAAPGAVRISGFVNQKESGIISSAGPIANIVLALLFLPLFLLSPTDSILLYITSFGFLINSWLALFNLIPFGIFDGAKVISWNKTAYAILTLTSIVLVFISTIIVTPGF